MKNLRAYLNQAYPLNTNWQHQLRTAFAIGLFIAVFLIVFQPFGLIEVESENKSALLGGYGITCFLVLIFDLILLQKAFKGIFDEERWTIWKQILFLIWIIFTIGLANSVYTILVFNLKASIIETILRFQIVTLAIGIIPVLVSTIITQNIYLKQNLKEAGQYSLGKPERSTQAGIAIKVSASNEKDQFTGNLAELLFIVSEGNYIQIHYLKDGKLKNTLLRNTIAATEEQLAAYPSIFKTHRAYLVNLDQIKKVSGNSQGLRLQLSETEVEVPVSRNYLQEFKQAYSSES